MVGVSRGEREKGRRREGRREKGVGEFLCIFLKMQNIIHSDLMQGKLCAFF